jgi:hypothetical protein
MAFSGKLTTWAYMKESDIKWEGKNFFVAWNKSTKRFEIIKNHNHHGILAGWNSSLETCIRVAKKLELYPDNVGGKSWN